MVVACSVVLASSSAMRLFRFSSAAISHSNLLQSLRVDSSTSLLNIVRAADCIKALFSVNDFTSSHVVDLNKRAHLSIPYCLSSSVAKSVCFNSTTEKVNLSLYSYPSEIVEILPELIYNKSSCTDAAIQNTVSR